jgi:hypothetical protein
MNPIPSRVSRKNKLFVIIIIRRSAVMFTIHCDAGHLFFETVEKSMGMGFL